MEGLGIAASIIAVIQLTGKIASICHGYISIARHARKDIEDLVTELNSLKALIEDIETHIQNGSAAPDALRKLDKLLSTFKTQLEIMESKLTKSEKEPNTGMKFIKLIKKKLRPVSQSLAWPLRSGEVMDITKKIERYKTDFMLALGLDNWSQLQAIISVHNLRIKADDSARNEEIRKKVLHWLCPDDFEKTHTEIGSLRQKDTGSWLLKSDRFKKLVDGEEGSRLLWGYGIPGAGKTFLSFAVADHFLSQHQKKCYGVAYFYFNYKEQEQQRPSTVIASLIKQLASKLEHLPQGMIELYKLEKENRRPTFAQLVDVLLTTFKLFGRVFIIFDALDECDEELQRRELLPLLHKMADAGASLFVTSRQHPEDIRESFNEVTKIELSAQSDDIRAYVEARIEKHSRVRRLVNEGNLKDSIISQLIECANGMFLAVRFHVQYLCCQTTLNQVRDALETLKSHVVGENLLDPTYHRVVEAIKNQPKNCAKLAIKVLSWLVHAKRVLTVKEIQTAVAIVPGRYEIEDSDLPDIKTLLDVCFGLVTIDENTDTIRLSHLTVHEYLMRSPIMPKDANLEIAIACTTYNSFSILGELAPHQFLGKEDLWQTRLKLYPFVNYSALFMPSHLETCDEELTQDTVFEFLQRPDNLNFWILWLYRFGKGDWRYNLNFCQAPRDWPFSKGSGSEVWTPLEGACQISHCLLVQRLSGEGRNSPIALRLAVLRGDVSIVRVLVNNGICNSIPDHADRLPLHFAAKNGLEEIVGILIDYGAEIETRDYYMSVALHQAAICGHEAVVKLLLDRGADIKAKDNAGMSALHHAAERKNEAVVKLLLDWGANIEAKDNGSMSALHHAVKCGNEAVVKLLLDRGADIEAKDNYGKSALHYAAAYWDEVVVKLLLDRGADIEAKDNGNMSALHRAAEHRNEAAVKLLLDRGADIEAKDNDSKSALHYAAAYWDEAVVKLLLDRGADIEAKDNYGKSALHYAAWRGHKVVVKLLLDRGANIEVKNNNGNSALHHAAEHGNEAVVELLLERGADSRAKNARMEEPLHLAAKYGRDMAVQLLLENGVNMSAEDIDGSTALQLARHGLDDDMTMGDYYAPPLDVCIYKTVIQLLEDAGKPPSQT